MHPITTRVSGSTVVDDGLPGSEARRIRISVEKICVLLAHKEICLVDRIASAGRVNEPAPGGAVVLQESQEHVRDLLTRAWRGWMRAIALKVRTDPNQTIAAGSHAVSPQVWPPGKP